MCCNQCGREIRKKKGLVQEDMLEVTKEWGYFSEKDLDVHHFLICEDCYGKWIAGFKIPVDCEEKLEILSDRGFI